MKKTISIVVPVFNEEENITLLYEAIKHVLQQNKNYSYEILFIDDGSTDGSWNIIESLSKQDNHIRAFLFSRNFGHQAALMAGYMHAQGDAIISIDADMQHPPALILDMVQAWEQGANIVYARKVNRKDFFAKRWCSFLFYRILDCVSDTKIPRNVSDFRLIDKQVLAVLCACPEQPPYLRGLVAWTGFKEAFVDCQYFERHAGTTGYSWKKMFQLAWSGVVGFALLPLRLAAFFSFILFIISCFCGVYFLVQGFDATFLLLTVVCIFLSVQFFILWMLGEYIGAIHVQQKRRPLYIIKKKVDHV